MTVQKLRPDRYIWILDLGPIVVASRGSSFDPMPTFEVIRYQPPVGPRSNYCSLRCQVELWLKPIP